MQAFKPQGQGKVQAELERQHIRQHHQGLLGAPIEPQGLVAITRAEDGQELQAQGQQADGAKGGPQVFQVQAVVACCLWNAARRVGCKATHHKTFDAGLLLALQAGLLGNGWVGGFVQRHALRQQRRVSGQGGVCQQLCFSSTQGAGAFAGCCVARGARAKNAGGDVEQCGLAAGWRGCRAHHHGGVQLCTRYAHHGIVRG